MVNFKYAIRFPELQAVDKYQKNNIFSESSIIKTTETFNQTFDALGSLTEFVIQKNRTKELSKQLNAKREALDISIENLKEQKRIEIEEFTKRLQVQLEIEKKGLELETKRLILEATAKVNDFSVSFEEYMMNNQLLHNLISTEFIFLDSIKEYINSLADDYSQRKEYVQYCELQRKSLNLIEEYMNQMI